MLAPKGGEGLRHRGTVQGCGNSEIVWAEAGCKACEQWGQWQSRLLVVLLSRSGLLLLLLLCKASPQLHMVPRQQHNNQTNPKGKKGRMTCTCQAPSL